LRRFEKVSPEEWNKARKDFEFISETHWERLYDEIKLPERKTKKSAGYDFHVPFDVYLPPNKDIKIPSGIRVLMEDDEVLLIPPRSSLGFKYYMRLANVLGVIDADYSDSDNEGHIYIKVRNEGDKPLSVKQGDAIVQGIFTKYLITDDDSVEQERNGGIGSTN
jgi:dUTP pyrophosphatase